ncbi:MAG: 50S ribosomal protein L35 [Deltaproteobacteria bacterium]|nr:50S ribosomal protein L35 [Deltaproteobacteria bacterium]
MPKMKTKRAAAKRFRVAGSGKIKRGHADHRHILSNKSMKRKRGLRGGAYVDSVDEPGVRRLIPYMKA